MRLTVNATVSYTEELLPEDLDAIKEDISDCLTWTGIAHGSGTIVELKVENE